MLLLAITETFLAQSKAPAATTEQCLTYASNRYHMHGSRKCSIRDPEVVDSNPGQVEPQMRIVWLSKLDLIKTI